MRSALIQGFADAQTAERGMSLPLFLRQPADPPASRIVGAVAAKNVVDLRDQFPCEFHIAIFAGPAIKTKEVADGERVRPEIAARGCSSRHTS